MSTTPSDLPPVVRDAAAPRTLLREAVTATLATFDGATGHPFASLIAMATAPDGTPLLLLSKLARHTRNLESDARASILVATAAPQADVLTAPRLTLVGEIRVTSRPEAAPRYLARHPEAEGYASFSDFSYYEMSVSTGHLVAGFGRIMTIPAADLLIDIGSAAPLLAAEPDIVAHMNSDHRDAVSAYAIAAGVSDTPTRMTGIDPQGLDLRAGSRGLRLDFTRAVLSPADAQRTLATLAGSARAAISAGKLVV